MATPNPTPYDSQSTLQKMWNTRPPRIPKDQGGNAMIAGVCEGIGARYRLDPVLVRLIFVALSLVFGGGLFVYFLCWLCMPRYGMKVSPGRAIATPKAQLAPIERKERSTGWWLVIGLLIFCPSVSYAADARAVLIAALVCFAAWYLAYRRAPEPPTGLMPGSSFMLDDAPFAPTTPPAGSYPYPGNYSTGSTAAPAESYPYQSAGGNTPPAWDPLGAAPQLWHLPDPSVYPEPTRPAPKASRAWIWIPIGVAAALLTGAALFATTDHSDDNPGGEDPDATVDAAAFAG